MCLVFDIDATISMRPATPLANASSPLARDFLQPNDALTRCADRATGHRRCDAFVVRVGGFAACSVAARTCSVGKLCAPVASVSASAGQASRAALRATQARQTQMHRFHLKPAHYLSDLDSR